MIMAGFIYLVVLSLCSTVVLQSNAMTHEYRAYLIESAIAEVKDEFAQRAQVQSKSGDTVTQNFKAFKMSTPAAKAQGRAMLLLEKAVKVAEKKIIEEERKTTVKTEQGLAASLIEELYHKPGSILTSQEINQVYSICGCPELASEMYLKSFNCEADDKIYRRPDGTCNNLKNPFYGAVNTIFTRLLPSRYADGIMMPRGSLQIPDRYLKTNNLVKDGPFDLPNPSARTISRAIIKNDDNLNTHLSHMFMQWGQFIDHDMDATPETESCPHNCNVDEECAPILVRKSDKNVKLIADYCQEFHRSLPACPVRSEDGKFGIGNLMPREQFNGITHWIDASNVYGSTKDVLDALRDKDGLLKSQYRGEGLRSYMPILTKELTPPIIKCPSYPCFMAGDHRANEQPALVAMHTLWLREHNRIAKIIKEDNPSWCSDTIFQITRKIVGAEMQAIVYNEFLPILIGSNYRTLIPDYDGYNSKVVPNIPNSFAAAAFRFGHSLVRDTFSLAYRGEIKNRPQDFNLQTSFFNIAEFVSTGPDAILRGLLKDPLQMVDNNLNEVLTGGLFAPNSSVPGLDLAALNIERGRDHGLPPYIVWKEWAKEKCGIESHFSKRARRSIGSLYGRGNENNENLDLFVGGISEEPVEGGVTGATFTCIMSQTFQQLRDGDRFYYENENVFTVPQIAETGKVSLSRILCDNSDIAYIQPNAFLNGDERVDCKEIPPVDLKVWYPTYAPAVTSTSTIQSYGDDIVDLLQAVVNEIKVKMNTFGMKQEEEFANIYQSTEESPISDTRDDETPTSGNETPTSDDETSMSDDETSMSDDETSMSDGETSMNNDDETTMSDGVASVADDGAIMGGLSKERVKTDEELLSILEELLTAMKKR